MNQFKKLALFVVLFCNVFIRSAFADEGMWFPQLLQQLNAEDMKLRGLQISIDDIYSVNKSSLKDAVVLFGGGCTGEIISKQGLLLTNHHCGFDQIQTHSSVENNYLKDGFWAKELKDELPCPGLSVTFVISINDVTDQFNKVLTADMTEAQRNEKIKALSSQIEKKAVEGTGYEARVRQFFSGNEFYVIITETFKDVRMVGAPPSAIGKFGGDTDNWMWPRHTGDFSMFRVYADKQNKPAEYSADNVPYTPRASFPINISGVKEGDFTMVYGFPGRTQEYISSYQEDMIVSTINPERIRVRDERLRIMGESMRKSDKLHLQYAAKQSSVSNGWKKWKGETKGLIESNGLQKKQILETEFNKWMENNPERKKIYANVLPGLKSIYDANRPYISANNFYAEAVYGVEILSYANGFRTLSDLYSSDKPDTKKMEEEKKNMLNGISGYFRNYDVPTDRTMFLSLLAIFDKSVPDSLKPSSFTDMRNRYKGDFTKWADVVFKKSIFTDSMKVEKFLNDFSASSCKKLKKDPAYAMIIALSDFYKSKVADRVNGMATEVGRLNRLYMAGQREMQPDKHFYPDANSTLRVAYGQVKSYFPRDAVKYNFYTTLDGIMEKYVKGDEEFDVPQKLIDLYNKKDYGRYAVNGELPIAFIATNHTTGGNSGSPVINAKGQLIGTNFDRVWEGTMSDISFNPEICRNVTLDIRYTLFVIERYAGATRLINEMEIVN